jgi:hypothetical protein
MKKIFLIILSTFAFISCVEEEDDYSYHLISTLEEENKQIEDTSSNPGLISPGHDGLFD